MQFSNSKQNTAMVFIRNLPYKLVSSTYNTIRRANNYVRVDKTEMVNKRIRIPRYFSYTKELEPYSEPKAYVVQIMKYNEHIVSIYTIDQTEVVFTESRLLHVIKANNKTQNIDHWSLSYSDIVSVQVRLSYQVKSSYRLKLKILNTLRMINKSKKSWRGKSYKRIRNVQL